MGEWIEIAESALCFASGLWAFGLGVLLTGEGLARAARVRHKDGLVHASLPEGWGRWYFDGFAEVAMAVYGIRAVISLIAWIALGSLLLGIGWNLLH